MDYREFGVPEDLSPFVRAIWRLSGEASPGERLAFDAMPDGCVELIYRSAGTSNWNGAQPRIFVAGICTRPARLRFSGDAEFVGVRLWPWAWNRLGGPVAPSFHDRWLPVGAHRASPFEGDDMTANLRGAFAGLLPDPIGRHVPTARSTGEVAEASGRNHRAIQRWFRSEIGMAGRQYFRLLRFQRAVEDGGRDGEGLAQEAAKLGYSDQAHMSRDFKRHSGTTAREVRAGAKGPFLDR
ncbi:MAG: helix-turn-helix domain-containing protein [Erythrobacter sp.]